MVLAEIEKRTGRVHNEYAKLIGVGGYIAPDDDFWNDLMATLVLRKPILLKGPTGAGKTKLAETLSATFKQPIQSINCSVDLDAESLLGFKSVS